MRLPATHCQVTQYPLGESNPCLRTENPMSWATRRRGQSNSLQSLAIWVKQHELEPFLPACQLSLLRCRVLTRHQTRFPSLYDEYEKHTPSKAFTVEFHKSSRGALFSSLPLTSIDASKNAPSRQSQFQTQFVSR